MGAETRVDVRVKCLFFLLSDINQNWWNVQTIFSETSRYKILFKKILPAVPQLQHEKRQTNTTKLNRRFLQIFVAIAPEVVKFYHSLFHSLLSYGIIFWGQATNTKKLFLIQ
jgi:hypothetical protein